MLTAKQSRFGFEYCKDYNGTRAAIRAGYSEKSAQETASRLISNPMVQERIARREEEMACRAEVDANWVFKEWHDIATADPRELMKLVVRACRVCWPAGLDLEEPNPLCPEPIIVGEGTNMGGCGGRGYQYVRLTDTSQLSRKAAKLIASIKETKQGIEIKLRDQDAALLNIGRAVGAVIDRKEVSGPGGGPIELSTSVDQLTDAQLLERLAVLKALREGSIEGTCKVLEESQPVINELGDGSNP